MFYVENINFIFRPKDFFMATTFQDKLMLVILNDFYTPTHKFLFLYIIFYYISPLKIFFFTVLLNILVF